MIEYSNCCHAEVDVEEGDSGSSYYVCSMCEQACDVDYEYSADQEQNPYEEDMYGL